MSKTTDPDPIAAAAAVREAAATVRERGVEHLRHLRERQTELHAARDRECDEIDTQVATAEQEFADAEAAQQHAEQLDAARHALDAARAAYDEAVTLADRLIGELRADTDALIAAFVAAREADDARMEAGAALRRRRDAVTALGEPVPDPTIYVERLLQIPSTDPLVHIARAALALYPRNPALRQVRVPRPLA